MVKDIPCNLCNRIDIKVIYEAMPAHNVQVNSFDYACTSNGHGEHYRIVRCRNCGLLYCSPRQDSQSLEEEYSRVQDDVYIHELKGRSKTFQKNFDNIRRYKDKGKLLDVGCSVGCFLDIARRYDWEVCGIEPSKWCVEQAEKLFNLKLIQGTYKDLANFKDKFDVITMWDVLEHLDDPREALIRCRRVLKDDGILVFSTVNIGSLYARLLGKKWPWLMKMHIYYFDKKTIRRYLEETGLQLIKIQTYKHIVSIDYLLYKLKKNKIFLYWLVKLFKVLFVGNKEMFIPVAMGDFIEVYVRRNK